MKIQTLKGTQQSLSCEMREWNFSQIELTPLDAVYKLWDFWTWNIFLPNKVMYKSLVDLTSLHRRMSKHEKKMCVPPIGERLNTHFDFCEFCQKTCQHATRGALSLRLTCIHAIVSRSSWSYGWLAPDKWHCKQWTSSLFLLIFA